MPYAYIFAIFNKVQFIEDLYIQSMLHALTIRSPVAKGSIREIEVPKMPGSYKLITAKDIPGKNELDEFHVPILASSSLSYIGEAVALLIGPDLARLNEYADKCIVKINDEPQETVTEPYAALDYNARDPAKINSSSNIINAVYKTHIQEHWYSEPHGALAVYSDNQLTVHTATQWPFHVKRSLEKVINIQYDQIEIIPTRLAYHLDGKLVYPSLISCQAAVCAFIAKKPVKLMLTRTEDFLYSPKRNSSEITISSEIDEKGKILSAEVQTVIDLGAHDVFSKEILNQTSLACLGIYRFGDIKLNGTAKRSNIPFQGSMEGFGMSQGFFAVERHVSRIADSLNQDPAEWRKNNFLSKNDKLAIGIQIKEPIPMIKLMDSAASMSDYYRKWASYELLRASRKPRNRGDDLSETKRGIGIAAAYQGSGFLFSGKDKSIYGVELTLTKDSRLEIYSSIIPETEENLQIWYSIAGTILGVDKNQIKISFMQSGLDSGPACLSRNISVITRLVERCCEAIRKQRFRDPLPITVRRAVRPDKFSPWDNQTEETANLQAYSYPAWGASVVEIEIDNISYIPKIRGIWLIVDGGKILSPSSAKHSLKLKTLNALNWACCEKVVYIEGKIPGKIMQNYGQLFSEEIIPVHIDFFNNDNAAPKGIGELPYSTVPAAYVQAVSQAMDYHFTKIPLNAVDIWEAEKTKKAIIQEITPTDVKPLADAKPFTDAKPLDNPQVPA